MRDVLITTLYIVLIEDSIYVLIDLACSSCVQLWEQGVSLTDRGVQLTSPSHQGGLRLSSACDVG